MKVSENLYLAMVSVAEGFPIHHNYQIAYRFCVKHSVKIRTQTINDIVGNSIFLISNLILSAHEC